MCWCAARENMNHIWNMQSPKNWFNLYNLKFHFIENSVFRSLNMVNWFNEHDLESKLNHMLLFFAILISIMKVFFFFLPWMKTEQATHDIHKIFIEMFVHKSVCYWHANMTEIENRICCLDLSVLAICWHNDNYYGVIVVYIIVDVT